MTHPTVRNLEFHKGVPMGIRTGTEFRESLRDGRTVYVNGERVKDVTVYPPFQGV